MADLRLGYYMRELMKSGPGKAGVFMLGFLLLASIAIVIAFPLDFGSSRWGNPPIWADNPKSAPPVWSNLFSRDNRPRHLKIDLAEPSETETTRRATRNVYRYEYELDSDLPPTFVSFSLSEIVYEARPPVVTWTLYGPDGREIALERFVVSGPRSGEESPYKRYFDDPRRSVIGSDDRVIDDLISFFSESGRGEIEAIDISNSLEPALFGVPDDEGGYSILPGTYLFEAQVLVSGADDSIGSVHIVVGGGVFGAMGTDALGRDLALGLMFGLPVALLIGTPFIAGQTTHPEHGERRTLLIGTPFIAGHSTTNP